MVAVLVLSSAEPGRTSKDPKAVLVIDILQLITAAAGVAMQKAIPATVANPRTAKGIGSPEPVLDDPVDAEEPSRRAPRPSVAG
jgi:hypothetical protein